MILTTVEQSMITGKWAVVESSDENNFIKFIGDKEFDTQQEAEDFRRSKIPIFAKKSFDSVEMVGRFEERFAELVEKQYDRRSFYSGWLEGRADMLRELNKK